MSNIKRHLRTHYRLLAQNLSPEYKQQASREIVANVKELIATINSHSIGIYIPTNEEPDILPLKGFNNDYFYSVPRITSNNSLEYMLWYPHSKLVMNQIFHVEEIIHGKAVTPNICLVPGVAFSLHGDRLGHGAGHFDRYIAHNRKTQMQRQIYIAICFHEMLTTTLAPEFHDQKMDWVVTNKTIIKICK